MFKDDLRLFVKTNTKKCYIYIKTVCSAKREKSTLCPYSKIIDAKIAPLISSLKAPAAISLSKYYNGDLVLLIFFLNIRLMNTYCNRLKLSIKI